MIPFGDRAVRFDVRGTPRERRALLDALRRVAGVVDAIVTEEHACVVYDGAPPDLSSVEASAEDATIAEHVVKAVYDGDDLADVARLTGVDVARVHSSAEYEVSFVGFMPGFAYLRGLPDALVLPRRESPRPRVSAGSVAIAARYSGVYPSASPGGWHLLGRASGVPAWSLGDRVRFEPVSRIDEAVREAPRAPLALGRDEVASVKGFAHVVGASVRGRMHEGVPHGGPLVIEAFAKLGTRTAIEVFGSIAIGDVVVSSGKDARVAYVGLRDDAPLGARVHRGDRVTMTGVAFPSPATGDPIAVMPGPDAAPLEGTFRIAPASNRVGVRLEGPVVAPPSRRDDAPSTPMVKGAIELTPAGLVVLGPDHPTTGGYPVIAVLRERSMDAFYKLPTGATVRFTTE